MKRKTSDCYGINHLLIKIVPVSINPKTVYGKSNIEPSPLGEKGSCDFTTVSMSVCQ